MSSRLAQLTAFAVVATAACTAKNGARTPDTTSPAGAAVASAPALDAATVRQQLDSLNPRFGAAMVKGDTAALANSYTSDALLLPPGAKIDRGHAEIAKSFGGMLAQMKLTAFTLTTQDVITAGDYAIETGAYSMTVQPKTGKAETDVGKYLTVWQKQPDGSLKIVRDIFNSDQPMK